MKKSEFPEEERVIDRLLRFVDWAKAGKMVKSRNEFEKRCNLSYNYLYNTQFMTKSSIGCDQIAKIHDAFPMLNVTWVITGKGAMITQEPDEGYREGYENMVKKMQEIQKIIERR